VLRVEDAQERVLAQLSPLASETIAVVDAVGRVLAAEVKARRMLPPWDSSAMDGYAVRAGDGEDLRVVGTIGAGHPAEGGIREGEAMRIMTGAPLPEGADAIVMREFAREDNGRVRLDHPAREGDHVRHAGEDIEFGDVAVAAGTLIGPGDLALIASVGQARVSVHRRPRVAIVSTGDELVDVGEEPGPGQIVNSNSPMIAAMVRDAGGEPTIHPITRDDPAALRDRFREALDGADVMLSIGGVSVGEFDYVKDAMAAVGLTMDFWKVAMQPGKPIAFGVAGGKPAFGLPGNPASAFVSFELFVGPALRKLGGRREGIFRTRVSVEIDGSFERREGGRRLFLRAHVHRDGERLVGRLQSRQGSHMLRSLARTNALVEVSESITRVAGGERLPALLLEAI
jgi:molybdopterin molybdotransferase